MVKYATPTGKSIIGGIVGLVFGLYFFVYLGIPALQTLATANTTGIATTVVALIGLVSIIVLLGTILLFLQAVGVKIF